MIKRTYFMSAVLLKDEKVVGYSSLITSEKSFMARPSAVYDRMIGECLKNYDDGGLKKSDGYMIAAFNRL